MSAFASTGVSFAFSRVTSVLGLLTACAARTGLFFRLPPVLRFFATGFLVVIGVEHA